MLRDQRQASVVRAQGVWEEWKEVRSEISAGVEGGLGDCCGV